PRDIASTPPAPCGRCARSSGHRPSDFLGIAKTHLGGRRARVRALIRMKLGELDADLRELTAMRRALIAIAACRCDGDCPILERALGAPATTTVPRRSRRRQ